MECELEGITVYYETIGQGMPVVMLHGSPLDHTEMIHEMEPVFARRTGWQRIYLDLPGHGKTRGGEWITCMDDILHVLEGFIDVVLPRERFLVVGTSYGGYLAKGLVSRRGGQIGGVLLHVPVSHAHMATGNEELPAQAVLVSNPAIMEEARAEGIDWLETIAITENQGLLERARVLSKSVVDTAFLERIEGGFSFDVDKLPEPFPAPALFVLGRQDHWVGYRHAWSLADHYPRATFAALDGAGHMAWGERRTLCLALAADWLDRVEEWLMTAASEERV